MKSIAMRSVASLALAAFLVGCSGEESQGNGQKTVIDTSGAPEPTTSQSSSGIPSSGGAAKKKPDPVGALSPIVPK